MATHIMTGGTASAPLTPLDFPYGTQIYANTWLLDVAGDILQIGDGSVETFFDDTGWDIIIKYNSQVQVK